MSGTQRPHPARVIRELREALQAVAEMVDNQHDAADAREYWWPDTLDRYHAAMATANAYDGAAGDADDPGPTPAEET